MNLTLVLFSISVGIVFVNWRPLFVLIKQFQLFIFYRPTIKLSCEQFVLRDDLIFNEITNKHVCYNHTCNCKHNLTNSDENCLGESDTFSIISLRNKYYRKLLYLFSCKLKCQIFLIITKSIHWPFNYEPLCVFIAFYFKGTRCLGSVELEFEKRL